jgi:hypothetical protein
LIRSQRSTYLFLVALLALAASMPAFGSPNWTQPTPDELKMTSDPAAPDAPAVYLFREETVDDKLHFHRLYARIKILTERGKQYGDIEVPYEAGAANIRDIEGRTIHADGTVIPFMGKPYDKELVKAGNVKIMAKVFSMPDVQVGSIVEYRWERQYEDNYVNAPNWMIQQDLFVHKAHYHFLPFDMNSNRTITVKDSMGKERGANRLLYFPWLPPGAKVQEQMNGFDLAVDNVPPIPDEEYSPPLDSYSYRLIFYYSPQFTGADFWKDEGKAWSKDVDRFANPSDKIRQAVAQITAPGDTDDQKLQKIYAAVMTVENTRFTREHSAEENKAEGLRVKTAADIWEQKRGSDDEITRLFLSMARAAGLKASEMIVTERNRNLLNTGYLYWEQLEDEIAIVVVDGKETYFDPGQRYCEYGRLHWMHTEVLGMRQMNGGAALVVTPRQVYPDNQVARTADLELGPDGTLKGTVRIVMRGAEALRWRQEALRTDEQEVKKRFAHELQGRVPDGVHVTTDHIVGLSDEKSGLMMVMDVSGNMGMRTGKRIVLPSSFFEANVKPLFAPQKRENPVDLLYPYVTQDQVTMKLAPGLTMESIPTNAKIPLAKDALYQAIYKNTGGVYEQVRQMAVGSPIYKADQYPELRDFFQKSSAQDQEQLVVGRPAVAAGAADAGKSE